MLGLLAVVAIPTKVEIDYQEFAGLQIKVNGIHLVQGSAFQYYEEGWKRGIYSSNWRPKEIEKLANAGLRVRFQGDDGQVTGTHTFQRTMTGVKAVYEFRWRGDKPVRLENSLGLVWAPAVEKGFLKIDGKDALAMDRPFPGTLPVEQKQFGPAGGRFTIGTTFADIQVRVSPGSAIFFDARGHNQDWARNRELFWLGFIDQKIEPQQTLRYEVEWNFDIKTPPTPPQDRVQSVLGSQPLKEALRPNPRQLPIIPQPKTVQTGTGAGAELGRSLKFDLEARHQFLAGEFEKMLWRRYDRETLNPGPTSTVIAGRVSSLGLKAEGYRITSSPGRILVEGQDTEGLRNGFRTLVWAVTPGRGRLVVPPMTITDFPSLSWRGLHMFVGPTALPFQTRLIESYFAPLKINKVVIQCERSNWNTLPGIEVPITMKKEDLKELFERYRRWGFEPIPLIQSLGHTYWVFANGRNLDLAVNPDVPFTLDPRKDKTREMLAKLWDEAITLLQPKTVHFGLDEIDMRGIPDDPTFTSRLWNLHVPWLLDLAKKKSVAPMMWGDIMLGPGEGPDALHAKTKEEAKSRRAVLRPGTLVADWHYIDNPNPDIYTSLEVFKKAGATPIASTWDRPGNIRGFTHAAIRAGTPGILQTTWAGYESSEAAMVREFDQFAAYALAADYAWSGREEMPNKLPYDPAEVLTRLYFSPPEPVSTVPGDSHMVEGDRLSLPRSIGPIAFRTFAPRRLNTPLDPEGSSAPHELVWKMNSQAKEVALAVDSFAWVADNEPLAEVTARLSDGTLRSVTLRYGQHARAPRDPRPSLLATRAEGLSAFRLGLSDDNKSARIVELRVKRLSAGGGLRIHGLTTVSPK